MKKIIFFILLAQLSWAKEKDSLAIKNQFLNLKLVSLEDLCDACGCSANGGSMGFASMINNNFVGIRHLNQLYKSKNPLYTDALWYDEKYNTTQVWARIPVFKNIQITILIPYHFHQRNTETSSQEISGIGDITLLAFYQIYNTKNDSLAVKNTLQIGFGVKIPSGKFDEVNNSGSINQSYQLGTGSWDYPLAIEHILKLKKLGMNNSINYIVKTANEKAYQYGNQLNYGSTIFYLFEKNETTIAPQIGFAGEIYNENMHYKQTLKNTKGDILFGKIGLEMGKNKYSLGLNLMLPLQQNLASGNLEAVHRWSVNFNYAL